MTSDRIVCECVQSPHTLKFHCPQLAAPYQQRNGDRVRWICRTCRRDDDVAIPVAERITS